MVKRQRIARKPDTPPPAADAWVSSGGIDPEIVAPPSDTAPTAPVPEVTEKGKTYPHRVSFDMETAQYKRLKRAAFEVERPMNDVLREAVERWLEASGY